MRSGQRGYTLVELVICSAVLLTLLLISAPPLLEASAALRLQTAAAELVGTLRAARMAALRWDGNAAVKFRPRGDGTVTYALYRDGDGDGVLNADIVSGVDPELAPPRPLMHFGPRVWFGLPAGPPPPDPGDPGSKLTGDPVRFNRSDLASFGPLGTSTPGSLYLTDGRRLVAVRLFGRTGKVRVLTYEAETKKWR